MTDEKRKALEADGWRVGDAGDFLGLTPGERREVEARSRPPLCAWKLLAIGVLGWLAGFATWLYFRDSGVCWPLATAGGVVGYVLVSAAGYLALLARDAARG